MGKFRISKSREQELNALGISIREDIALYRIDTLTQHHKIAVLWNTRTDLKELVELVVE